MGKVTSTPNSKPTAIIGIIENPTKKQHSATIPLFYERNENPVPAILIMEIAEMTMTESLYVFLISTQTPKAADPIRPPMMNTAPNNDASSYTTKLIGKTIYSRKSISICNLPHNCTHCIKYSLNETKYNHE